MANKSQLPTPIKRSCLYYVWPLVYILSPIIPLLFFLIGNWYTFLDGWSFAIIFGTISYIYLLNQFITGVRLKYFDRIYGLDQVLRFHIFMAVIALISAVVHHQIFDFMEYQGDALQLNLGKVAIGMFFGISVASLLFFAGPLGRVRVIRVMRRFLQFKLHIQYQHLRAIHNIVAVAMLVALLHAVLAGVTQEQVWRMVILTVWYLVATIIYLVHKIVLPRKRKKHPYTVSKITTHPRYCTINLKPPHDKPMNYMPGQFGFIRFISGTQSPEEHPYTFSSAPHESGLSFTAKDVGDWSHRLANVSVGDKVAIDGPYGRFSYQIIPTNNTPLFFIARGAGITPFISMINALAHQKTNRNIYLMWQLSEGEQNFLEDTWLNAANKIPSFKYYVLPSSQSLYPSLSTLDKNQTHAGRFFVCGSPGFYRDITRYLKKRGIHQRAIHTEKFEF